MTNPRDPWPWSDRKAEYHSLFPAAVETVAEILEVAQPGTGSQLRDAGVEPAPTPWPVGDGPAPETAAGKLMELWNSLPATCISLPNPEQRDAQHLVGLLNQAVWHASHGEWYEAGESLKKALRSAWIVTGYRY
ncbi:hypothetical protein OG871_40580 (plasmid) [Kitasatospora sp. NBC_00374]|uniref:hypothetical protein n=1 Tax=Kitasatospora sp. NBC_00374 TaxID=2975964 RepID=UPI002F9090F2